MKNAVSLLPPEYLAQRAREHNLQQARSVMLAIALFLVAALISLAAFVITVAASLASLKDQNVKVQEQIQVLSTFEELATETALLQDKVDSIRTRDANWLLQMETIGNALPRGVVLQTFQGREVVRNPQGVPTIDQCDLVCVGSSFEDIAITIRALEKIGANAVCTTSVIDPSGSIVFSLSVALPLTPGDLTATDASGASAAADAPAESVAP